MDDTRGELTQREINVLRFLAYGMSHKEIAERLQIASSTVSNHVGAILLKLRAHNATQAVAIAIRDGLIESPRGESE
jgi:DNA-binding NarL/FixJ family response regulator